jgi:hypothetical protein
MKGQRPRGDIDYVIMSSANDEDRFAELLVSFRNEYPGIEQAAAIERLKIRLERLVSDGKVGIYESVLGRTYTSGSEYRELPSDEALALIRSAGIWEWEAPSDAKAIYYLFAKDSTYWGQYYGEGRKGEGSPVRR